MLTHPLPETRAALSLPLGGLAQRKLPSIKCYMAFAHGTARLNPHTNTTTPSLPLLCLSLYLSLSIVSLTLSAHMAWGASRSHADPLAICRPLTHGPVISLHVRTTSSPCLDPNPARTWPCYTSAALDYIDFPARPTHVMPVCVGHVHVLWRGVRITVLHGSSPLPAAPRK